MIQREAKHIQDGGCKVNMRGAKANRLSLWDAWPTDDERDVYVFFIPANLTRRQTMLANVVAVVGGIDDVRVIEHAVRVEFLNNVLHHLVNRLQRPEALPIVFVVVVKLFLFLTGEPCDPIAARACLWVEIVGSGNLDVLEQMFVASRGLRWMRAWITIVYASGAMGPDGSGHNDKGLVSSNSLVNQVERLICDDIVGVASIVHDRWLVVSLDARLVVEIRPWSQQERLSMGGLVRNRS